MKVRYALEGPLAEIKNLTESLCARQRKDELWKTTCFEWFLKAKGQSAYWECNLSSGGDWNLYQLSHYRSEVKPEPALSDFKFKSEKISTTEWSFEGEWDLSSLLRPEESVLINLCAVLETQDHKKSYWSLTHTQKQPDFHHADHFVLER